MNPMLETNRSLVIWACQSGWM